MTDCPVCSGPGELLGRLGRLEHYRCRHCGAMFQDDADDVCEVSDVDADHPLHVDTCPEMLDPR